MSLYDNNHVAGAIRHVAVYLLPTPIPLARHPQRRIGCVTQVPWTHPRVCRRGLITQASTYGCLTHFLPAGPRHHGPETHPHGHNSSSSEQWVCPDHERDDPDQTLRRPSRASNQSGSRCNCNCLLTKHELEEPVVQQLQDLDKVSRSQVRLGSLLIRPRRPSRIPDDHKWLHFLWLCAIPPMAMAM